MRLDLLLINSPSNICRKGGDLIHIPLYPNLHMLEGELINNKSSLNCYWFVLFFAQFQIQIARFFWYFLHTFYFLHKSWYFFCLFSSQFFWIVSKSWPTWSAEAYPPFSKSPTIDRPQQATKASIYAKQNLNFCIVIEWSIYRLIGICSNIIYGLFIVNKL